MANRRSYQATPMLLFYKQIISLELDKLEEYVSDVSSELEINQSRITKEYNKAVETIGEDEGITAEDFYDNDIFKYFHSYPKFTLNPLLLILYGQFENWLK